MNFSLTVVGDGILDVPKISTIFRRDVWEAVPYVELHLLFKKTIIRYLYLKVINFAGI